tara:strand:+ start:103 stop:375 length:273 start_codon:yes stop_codon:yes gene_type:complete
MQFEIGSVFRFVSWLFVTVLFDGVVKSTGLLLCRMFTRKVQPKSWITLLVGCLFWVFVILALAQINQFLAVDACLDAGGTFDYDLGQCIE